MQNVNQFEQHRAALEQCVHNSVHDAETRQAMLSHIGAMGRAMHAEERTADAAMRTTHQIQRTIPQTALGFRPSIFTQRVTSFWP